MPSGSPQSWGVLFWSCGPCHSDMGRFEFFMGRFGFGPGAVCRLTGRGSVPAARFAAVPGGAASPLPAIRRRTGNEDVAPPVWLNPTRSSVKWGCAFRVVKRRPLFCDSVVKDQIGSFLCHFPSAQAHLQSERSHVMGGRCCPGRPEGGMAFRRARPPIALAIASRPYTGR